MPVPQRIQEEAYSLLTLVKVLDDAIHDKAIPILSEKEITNLCNATPNAVITKAKQVCNYKSTDCLNGGMSGRCRYGQKCMHRHMFEPLRKKNNDPSTLCYAIHLVMQM